MYWGIQHPVFLSQLNEVELKVDKLFEYSKIIMFMIMPINYGKDQTKIDIV